MPGPQGAGKGEQSRAHCALGLNNMVTWCVALILSPGEVSAGLRTWLGQGQTLSDAPDYEHNPRLVYEAPDDHWPQA